jgi:D-alanyl-D-alanine carboxypeptidase/D-alanyl-D-alanine-endopeptidase (penicillin-binding protein 4)
MGAIIGAPAAHDRHRLGRMAKLLSSLSALARSASTVLACALALGPPVDAASAPLRPAAELPAPVAQALRQAGLPRESLAVVVVPIEEGQSPRLSWQGDRAMNAASVMKLATTFAALELLGPAYTWNTPVFVQGAMRDGTLHGNLYLRGSGDPGLVVEQLWLLLRRVQAHGIHTIAGDIVVDSSAFADVDRDPAAFDGEPLRPYNAAPDAFLANFKSLVLDLVPDAPAGLARIQATPPMAGLSVQASVALAPAGTPCGDWRAQMRLNLSDPAHLVFEGRYPAACGARSWALAPPQPELFGARAVAGTWLALGGRLAGMARRGKVPDGLSPLFVHRSVTLAQVVQSINKFSNNVMAQQVFLTLGLEASGMGSPETARAALNHWWRRRMGAAAPPRVDNGAGLSREARISAAALALMLQRAWASPVMPELVASLPIVGVDGTLRRSRSRAVGAAHLKTGSLQDALAIAGYVLGDDGRRWIVVAIVNDAQAAAARPVLDALMDWTSASAQR